MDPADLDPDAIEQFRRWQTEALDAELVDADSMVLATATPDGRPSGRTVLLRGLDHGFVFFTNDGSRKGRELADNPWAAAVFLWRAAHRQVNVTGPVERLTEAESDAYFAGRPRGHRIGAWASRQSAVIPDRRALEDSVAEIESRFAGVEVPRPPFWGGYRLVPLTVELWQERRDRLHDRLRYRRDDLTAPWVVERLAP